MKKGLTLLIILGMGVLILLPEMALQAAKDGLTLCFTAVIPALLPLWVLSALLTSQLWGSQSRLLSKIGQVFSIPQGAESLFIPAFLGGYPAGAGCIGKAYAEGKLEKKQAERLLGYCNNVGPAFLFGIVAPYLPSAWDGLYLWLLEILGAFAASCLLPGVADGNASLGTGVKTDLLGDSAGAMGKICVCVILFRIPLVFLQRFFPANGPAAIVISGFIELTNGCCRLSDVSDHLRLPLAAGLLAFGGLCVGLQTAAVTKGLDLRQYVLGKGIACITCVVGAVFPWSILLVVCLPLLKKSVAFLKKEVYNNRNSSTGRTRCYSVRK